MLEAAPVLRPRRLVWTVFFVSAGVLGYELALLRILLVASWHHFAFMVISLALLGFGASGTALALLRRRVLARRAGMLYGLGLATAVTIPICAQLAQAVPVEARSAPLFLGRQVGLWTLFWTILAVPFFVGAGTIGLALMAAGRRVATVYAGNLAGSGVGAVLATVAMSFVPPAWLPLWMGGLALAGVLPWLMRLRTKPVVGLLLATAVAALVLWQSPPRVRCDPFKYGAYVRRLVAQGAARRVAVTHSPRATVEVYAGPLFHELPFLSVGTAPPPMDSLVLDGHHGGSLLQINTAEDAAVVDQTLMAVPYALVAQQPRVALLGERDGVNVWLAARRHAARITIVQPDANLLRVVRRVAGGAFDAPGVCVVSAEPRHFVSHTSERFDLLQIVTLQSAAVGSGLGGLAEDHLVTVEGLAACLHCLREDGILAVCRGIQTPPRDNVKLLATLVEALRRRGVTAPGAHVVVVRDYLGVCTLVKTTPWDPAQVARVRELCITRQLTPVWFPGVRPDELNRPDALPDAPRGPGDWYSFAARELFAGAGRRLIDESIYDIRPPTDDRPFFFDFCKLGSLGQFRRAYGDLWLTRVELAFLFVLAAAAAVPLAGTLLTVLPITASRALRRAPGRGPTTVYFAAIGLAYLLVEMTLLSKLTRLIGDPVTATAVTIAALLLLSGAGSLIAQRIDPRRTRWLIWGAFLLVLSIAETPWLAGRIADAVGGWPLVARCAVAVLTVLPAGVLMGFPMPLGLGRLHNATPALVPLAWAVNGFASVLATPLAVILAMTWGYHTAALAAVGLYLLAGALFRVLPGRATRGNSGIPDRSE